MTEQFQFTTEQLDRIRDLAYEKFVSRGGEDGHDIEDWVAAEQEVLTCETDTADTLSMSSACQVQSCSTGKPAKEMACA